MTRIVGGLLFNGGVSASVGMAFAEDELRAVAGDRSFERGLGYIGAVSGLERAGDRVLATVRGARDYLVVLTLPGGRVARPGLRGECGCPYGQEGFFCKHCVAVALLVARASMKVPRPRAGRRGGSAGSGQVGTERGTSANLSSWLGELGREELLALVCDQLPEDPEWRQRLELRAAAEAAEADAVRERIASLLAPDEPPAGGREYYGYLEGPQARRYARRITEVSEAVAALTKGGQPGAAAVAAERAIDLVAAASSHMKDPAGSVVAAAADLARRHLDACLAGSHLDACLAGEHDPARLAGFLAGRLVSGDAVPALRLSDYARLLGPSGLERLCELVTAAGDGPAPSGHVRDALIEVLSAAGNTDGLVRVLAEDLDERGHAHLRIAAELDMAGRHAEALEWAERGLREVSHPDGDLASYVAERYCEQGRAAEAEAVLRAWFATDLSADGYRRLREQAEFARCWASVRPWALGLLQAEARRATAAAPARRQPAIVDALIGEGDVDRAWQAARGIASDRQWLALADMAAPERPADALAVYRRQIEVLRKRPCEPGYERLARLLESARECCERLGNLAEFESYLRVLRDEHKRRPRLIRVLDAHQL